MCGIFLLSKFTILNNSINTNNASNESNKNNKLYIYDTKFIVDQFNKGSARGPDNSVFLNLDNYFMGFHRLSINGLNLESNQPFIKDGIYVICNGEIYNFKYIYSQIDVKPQTQSDCEIIIDLYIKNWSIKQICSILDGVFAFIILDTNINKVFVGRDPFGVRPLYYVCDPLFNSFSFVSEIKQLTFIYKKIKHFPPGYYFENNSFHQYFNLTNFNYNDISVITNELNSNFLNYDNTKLAINNLLTLSVKKRLLTDRPFACLLSGGLDSSLICSIICKLLPKNQKLNTFSIGLKDSTDLFYADKVAQYLNTNHTQIVLSEEEFFNSIPEVIEKIESYDTTTVRASVGNYLISKYISQNTDFKVIFNGDGSDELTGGYLYFHKSPNKLSAHNECIRLLEDIYMFDVLRSDRSISSCGLEPRTPFLDKSFVNFYLSIPLEFRFEDNQIEKKLLRDSFENYLPKEVLYRKKEAFSDGVSSVNNSWYKIIQEKLENFNIKNSKLITMEEKQIKKIINHQSRFRKNANKYIDYNDLSIEQQFYKNIFDKLYPKQEHIIKYYWMPKWSNTKDPSARTL